MAGQSMVVHIFSLIFIAAMAYLSRPGSSLFSWHPFLMTIGFVGCIFQSILVFSRDSMIFGSLPHKTKVNLHWLLNTLGIVSILTAYAAIYMNKEDADKPHLTTWHGIIGLITIIYTSVQYVAGYNLTVFYQLVSRFIPYRQLATYHATSGTVLFVLACSSMCLGINSNWFSSQTSFFVWYLTFAVTAMFGLVVTNQVKAKYVDPKLTITNQMSASALKKTLKREEAQAAKKSKNK